MAKGLLGRKVGMTQIFDEAGVVIPVTVIEAGPCHVMQKKTVDSDGYTAIQIGFGDKPRRLAPRSERGHVAAISSKRSKARQAAGVEIPARAECEPKKFVKEIRGESDLDVGAEIKADVFDGVKSVDVIGITKGRGFSGVMKRHNFAGQRATHGVKKCHRYAGSTGMCAYPSRVFKGLRMPGQYGSKKRTSRNLKVVRVDAENNLLLVNGAVPGPNGAYVVVQETNMLK